jgi:hypothetical protein
MLCLISPAGLVLPSFPQHAVSVKYATEHRCGVVVRGAGLSDAISGTDPLKDNLPLLSVEALDDSSEVREAENTLHCYVEGWYVSWPERWRFDTDPLKDNLPLLTVKPPDDSSEVRES